MIVDERLPYAPRPREPRVTFPPSGCVTHARVGPPTIQHQGAVKVDLAAFAPSALDLSQVEAVHRLEKPNRARDPRFGRAIDFLDLRIVEDGAEEGNL